MKILHCHCGKTTLAFHQRDGVRFYSVSCSCGKRCAATDAVLAVVLWNALLDSVGDWIFGERGRSCLKSTKTSTSTGR